MRRILLLITDLEIGGTPTVVRELALRLHAAGNGHIEVACLSRWGPVADQIAASGIIVTPLNASNVLSLSVVVWRLIRLIRRGKIDAVLSFLVHANAVAALASVFFPSIRWFQSIQTTQPYPRWHWRVQALIHRAAEQVIVPSESVALAARHWAHVPAEKIVVIPNAIDLDSFREVRNARAILVDADNCPSPRSPSTHIGFIGRLDPIKRIPDLLEALSILDSQIHLDIYGDGSERQRLEHLVNRLNLNARVTFHGAVARPHEALAAIDLLVLPSQAEGFGLVLIEAMAAGVPVIGTDVPGIRDVITHGQTGILVPVASPARLAEAIQNLLDNPARQAALVAQALRDIEVRFSWQTVLPQYRQILKWP